MTTRDTSSSSGVEREDALRALMADMYAWISQHNRPPDCEQFVGRCADRLYALLGGRAEPRSADVDRLKKAGAALAPAAPQVEQEDALRAAIEAKIAAWRDVPELHPRNLYRRECADELESVLAALLEGRTEPRTAVALEQCERCGAICPAGWCGVCHAPIHERVMVERIGLLRRKLLEMADEQNNRQQAVYTARDIRDAIEREDVLRSAAGALLNLVPPGAEPRTEPAEKPSE